MEYIKDPTTCVEFNLVTGKEIEILQEAATNEKIEEEFFYCIACHETMPVCNQSTQTLCFSCSEYLNGS